MIDITIHDGNDSYLNQPEEHSPEDAFAEATPTSATPTSATPTSTALITIFICWTSIVYIVTCLLNKDALTPESIVFHIAVIILSGGDGLMYGFKQLPWWIFIANLAIQAGVLVVVVEYSTANPAIKCDTILVSCKLVLMAVQWVFTAPHNTEIITPAPWDAPIDLSDNEQPDWTCAICLESQPRRVVKFQNCMHMMHPECARELIKYHSVCPECKEPLH